jgi:hypothetical protein
VGDVKRRRGQIKKKKEFASEIKKSDDLLGNPRLDQIIFEQQHCVKLGAERTIND